MTIRHVDLRSVEDLRAREAEIERQMQRVQPGSDEFDQLLAEQIEVRDAATAKARQHLAIKDAAARGMTEPGDDRRTFNVNHNRRPLRPGCAASGCHVVGVAFPGRRRARYG